MNDCKLVWLLLLTVTVFAAGCAAKKSNEQSSIAGTGFDSATVPATTTEELAQLPQAGAVAQQAGVEALPVEASPVTLNSQLASPSDVAYPSSTKSFTHEQEIQTALKNLGLYTGKIDGKIGPGTKRAIEEFQKQNGLKVDGKVGPKTWSALSQHLTASADAVTPAGAQ